jgi:hypothetical protein
MIMELEVQRGLTLLDRRVPTWRSILNVETLDIGSTKGCVLGQVFGTFRRGLVYLGIEFPEDCGASYGFTAYEAYQYRSGLSPRFVFSQLTRTWRNLIERHVTPIEWEAMMGRSEETREKNRREIEAAMQGMTVPPLPFEEYRHLLIRPTYLPVVDLAQIERWRAEAAGSLERIQVVPPEWVFNEPIVQPNGDVFAALSSLVPEPNDAETVTETVERELALV